MILETPYLDLLKEVLSMGDARSDRTGVGTRSLFGRQLRFNLRDGFPAVTTKKLYFHSVVVELLWFLSGKNNIKDLHAHGVHIWDEWADSSGDLGPVYGVQWRRWSTGHGARIDQIKNLIEGLKSDPYSRRHLVSAWNVGDLSAMALAPCHVLFQCYVSHNALSCQVYQRSADLFLGVPFNIASYALLTHLLAREVGLGVGELIWVGGDCHIYENHIEQVQKQLIRVPYDAPILRIADGAGDIFSIEPRDITLEKYVHHPAIPAPIAV